MEECIQKASIQKNLDKIREIKEYGQKNGCIVLTEEYINRNTPVKFICSCGNENAEKPYYLFKRFPRCRKNKNCISGNEKEEMTKKYNEVFEYFLKYDCKLLSENIRTEKDMLNFLCRCGNTDSKSFKNFKRSPKCKKCKSAIPLENIFEKNNCILLTPLSVRNRTYNFICRYGIEDFKTYSGFEKSPQCRYCDRINLLKIVEEKYEEKGCKLLSQDFFLNEMENLSDQVSLEFLCVCGNIGEKPYHGFLTVSHCHYCTQEIRDQKNSENKIPYSYIKEIAESNGFKMLTKENEFINVKQQFKGICPEGHETPFYYTSMKAGCICCQICSKISFKERCMERYGVENPSYSKEIQQKKEENSLKNGELNILLSTPMLKKKWKNLLIDTKNIYYLREELRYIRDMNIFVWMIYFIMKITKKKTF